MKKVLPILAGVLLLGGSAALVIVAERRGWLPGAGGSGSSESCPHGLSRENCPFCDPSLVESLGQCGGHGVPEAFCTRCNSSLVVAFKKVGDWCAEHKLPESQCTICNPGVQGSGEALIPSIDLVPAPDVARSRRAPSVSCSTNDLRVQFTSTEIAAQAGLEYARVESREITQSVISNAEVTFDQNRYSHLSSRAPGVVREVMTDLGQSVESGQVLAVIDSVDLGGAKAGYLQAAALVKLWERNHAREKRLTERRIGAERDLLEAEAKLSKNRVALSRSAQRLRTLGLTESQVKAVAEEEDTSSLLPLTAPFSGTVVERSATLGEVVDTATPLFAVSDTSKVWAMLDVYEADIRQLELGQPVVLEVEALRGERYAGQITWLSSHVDRRTRTLKARSEFANPEGFLRAGMFAKAIVSVREKEFALVVPKEAVQWEGCCNVVFVRKSGVLFEPRKVRLGYETDRFFVAETGVKEQDVVVTTGSFLLKTEILKGSIGAGCCEANPGTN